MAAVSWLLRCVECGQGYPGLEVRYRCGCGGTLDPRSDGELCGPCRRDLPRASIICADTIGGGNY